MGTAFNPDVPTAVAAVVPVLLLGFAFGQLFESAANAVLRLVRWLGKRWRKDHPGERAALRNVVKWPLSAVVFAPAGLVSVVMIATEWCALLELRDRTNRHDGLLLWATMLSMIAAVVALLLRAANEVDLD